MKYFVLIILIIFTNAKEFVSISYEKWKFNKEIMGISKLSLNKLISNNIYYGISFFGAAEGKRGGFFTFGYNIGLKYYFFDKFYFNPEFFIGAGGGGAAPQGGGLMIREALGLNYEINDNSFGIGYSFINFLNGDIKSSQIFMSLTTSKFNFKSKDIIIYFPYTIYLPFKNVITTDNKFQKKMYLLGIKARILLNKIFFSEIDLNGAFKTSNGYMDIFIGGGVYNTLFKNLNLYLLLAIGEGGGGKVKTDGGFLTKSLVGLDYQLKNCNISAEYGFINNTSFKAKLVSLNLGMRDNFENLFKKIKYRLILKLHTTTNKGKQYLEGISFDYFINKRVFIGGKSLWAFGPNSGGYTEGVLSIGMQYRKDSFLFLPEVYLGVAGGGGIDVGKGYFIGGDFNIGVNIGKFLPFIGIGISKFSNRISKDFVGGFFINF